ncbi:GlxA family transcriptional regulator [Nocardioides aurantiacus]|uniref:AraC family transcriptional regulator with amidase-like domain n=1 Tax=Nocardioides aurantiacus TaxID=86796 RepID=A0A3N2CPD4_9ACTN|nr:helix-turn-helix domain-containing protein [Nocardioides aurantiacus]ROR89383.1 AraC family transcriptional regulator with amidase-like domain [Nocardioides aurantiacus]
MKIAIHAFEGISMFHLAVPSTVFCEVGALGLAPGWRTTVWSTDPRVTTSEGLSLDGLAGPEALLDADLLVFPSWHPDLRPPGAELSSAVQDAVDRGARLVGLCLGAFPLAGSGLLDGRAVVTHWGAAQELATRYPAVEVNPDAIYVDHGDVLTSAGTASALDACLHVVRRELGSEAAATLARHLVVAPHRDGGQAQYIRRPLPEPDGVGQLGATIDWALAHLEEQVTVEAMAAHAGMSRRNFTRRFGEATGASPAQWLTSRRLDESRRLLERSTLPVGTIAARTGFGSAVTFRQRFADAYGTTPTSYRRRFAVDEGA